MIVFILLILVFICTIIGFFYLFIDIKKLNKNENRNAKKQDMPFYLKRSFQFLAGAFLLLILISLF